MKVLMINVSCGNGSTGRICTDLAQSLERSGQEIKIAYGRDCVKPEFEKYAVRIGSDFEVKTHALYARLMDASGLGSKRGTKRFISWIKEYEPDIIHLHNIHGYYINAPILFDYLRSYKKPIIWTLHDCWSFTGHSAYCDSINCQKWLKGCNRCSLLSEYPKSYLDYSERNWKWKKACFTSVDNMRLVTPSKWLAGLAGKSFLSKYPITVIHNGIDTSIFQPQENDFRKRFHLEDKRIILGVASVWNDMKGLRDFINLSSLVESNSVIVLVGLSKVQLDCLPGNVLGIEKTNNPKELSHIYSSADVFVNMTYCDNFPTTNLEAKACGLRIVTYKTGGSPESAGEDAIIVEKGNVKRVAYEIRTLFASEMKKNFTEKVQDINDTTEEYMAIYESAL